MLALRIHPSDKDAQVSYVCVGGLRGITALNQCPCSWHVSEVILGPTTCHISQQTHGSFTGDQLKCPVAFYQATEFGGNKIVAFEIYTVRYIPVDNWNIGLKHTFTVHENQLVFHIWEVSIFGLGFRILTLIYLPNSDHPRARGCTVGMPISSRKKHLCLSHWSQFYPYQSPSVQKGLWA